MTTQTLPTDQNPQPFYSAEVLYDELMSQIEPELMIVNIDLVDDLHEHETEQERLKRYEHYADSFTTYKECLNDLADLWKEDAEVIKKAMENYALMETRRSDDAIANDIAHSIDSSND